MTGDTEIECMTGMQDEMSRDGGGGQGGGDQSQGSGDEQRGGGDHGDEPGAQDNGDQPGADDNGDEPEAENTCSMTDLAPGATVREAELRVSGAGSVWRKIELGA